MHFSLLIAHYNNFEYFKECYKSILNQTYQDFEVVIVDDCSTDNSFYELKKLASKDFRIKLFQNSENKGVGFTKRRCIEMAGGDICGFLDPDDAIIETAVEKSLKSYDNTAIVATHSDFLLCDENLSIKKKFPNTRKVKNNNSKFFNINFQINHFFTFRKSVYEQTSGINLELTSAVDQDLYLKMYDSGEVKYISEGLYLYRLHEKGVSQEKSKKQKLNKNWHTVLEETLKRRNIKKLYGKDVSTIENLPRFIFEKQNTLISKVKKRFL